MFKDWTIKITTTSPRGQWVNQSRPISYLMMPWLLSYYSDLTLLQEFQPMVTQLSKKAAHPLAKILVTTSCRSSKKGPKSQVWLRYHQVWYQLCYADTLMFFLVDKFFVTSISRNDMKDKYKYTPQYFSLTLKHLKLSRPKKNLQPHNYYRTTSNFVVPLSKAAVASQ